MNHALSAALDNGYAIFVIATMAVGLVVTIYFLPSWWADRKNHQEPIEPLDLSDDGPHILAALARRAGLDNEAQR